MVKLNLGCGTDKRVGYINIDANAKVKPDLVHDLTKRLPFQNSSVDEIIIQDVLEHLTKEDGEKLILECSRVLTNKGKIKIRIPDIFSIIKKFKGQDDLIMLYVYGDTSLKNNWDSHKFGYTKNLIKEILSQAKIKVRSIEKIDTNLTIIGLKENFEIPEIVCQDLISFLKTPIYFGQGKKIIWKVDKKYSVFLGKTILRKLSKYAANIICTPETKNFVLNILRYSHLRIRVSNKN